MRLVSLAGLTDDPKCSRALLRDIEEVLTGYRVLTQEKKNRPSPASQRRLFTEVKQAADRLRRALLRVDPYTKDVYNLSGPFKYRLFADWWSRDVNAVSQIISLAEQVETTLSRYVQPGNPKNTAIRNAMTLLFLALTKHVPSLTRETLENMIYTALTSAQIKYPDPNDSPRQFWSLLFPPLSQEDRVVFQQIKENNARIAAGEHPFDVLRSRTKPTKS